MSLSNRIRRALGALALTAVLGAAILGAAVLGAAVPAMAAVSQPPAAQDEYVPVKEVPPEDQLPAAPLLIGAYAIAWVAILGYLWSIWSRLGTVERELQQLRQRAGQGKG